MLLTTFYFSLKVILMSHTTPKVDMSFGTMETLPKAFRVGKMFPSKKESILLRERLTKQREVRAELNHLHSRVDLAPTPEKKAEAVKELNLFYKQLRKKKK